MVPRSYPNHSSYNLLCAGVLNDVLNLVLHRLKDSSFVKTSSDPERKGKQEEEQTKEKLARKAYQFLTAFALLVPIIFMHTHDMHSNSILTTLPR